MVENGMDGFNGGAWNTNQGAVAELD